MNVAQEVLCGKTQKNSSGKNAKKHIVEEDPQLYFLREETRGRFFLQMKCEHILLQRKVTNIHFLEESENECFLCKIIAKEVFCNEKLAI